MDADPLASVSSDVPLALERVVATWTVVAILAPAKWPGLGPVLVGHNRTHGGRVPGASIRSGAEELATWAVGLVHAHAGPFQAAFPLLDTHS